MWALLLQAEYQACSSALLLDWLQLEGRAALAAKSKGDIGDAARATGDVVGDIGKSLKRIVKGCDWISSKLQKEETKHRDMPVARK